VFVGKYERQLDPKGRLALPSDFRPRFEPRCYLAYGQDGCIEVMTPEAFEAMANELMERQKRGELTLAELRTKASNAFSVSVDGQGRVTIDREMRAFAGIEPGSPVVVSGAFDRVEVWHPEAFERINTAGGLALKGSA
jgi:MraZ protein